MSETSDTQAGGDAIQTVSLSFFRFAPGFDRVWAFTQMGAARWAMSRLPGLGFWKLCGSGTGEGFTPRPNWGVYAILATWPDLEAAERQTAEAPVFRRYHDHAEEAMTVFLSTTSVRGRWSGREPFEVTEAARPGPVAALTRATIRPTRARAFWGAGPDISDVIGADPNVRFKIGIGEVPWLRQVTFSIWPDTSAMARFARGDGPHGRAIRAVREGGWFSEELYARFRVRSVRGTWEGRNPVADLEIAA
ncbi:spheroidene monooxygenase [Rhodosalinus sp. 5P4]|uniref:spheroidene monooxygenase n=1 Tax=Rhodosalinus sp. 5P4 TaxID=3239196 RepID=UPI0035233A93